MAKYRSNYIQTGIESRSACCQQLCTTSCLWYNRKFSVSIEERRYPALARIFSSRQGLVGPSYYNNIRCSDSREGFDIGDEAAHGTTTTSSKWDCLLLDVRRGMKDRRTGYYGYSDTRAFVTESPRSVAFLLPWLLAGNPVDSGRLQYIVGYMLLHACMVGIRAIS
jgi:hypothetical protein